MRTEFGIASGEQSSLPRRSSDGTLLRRANSQGRERHGEHCDVIFLAELFCGSRNLLRTLSAQRTRFLTAWFCTNGGAPGLDFESREPRAGKLAYPLLPR